MKMENKTENEIENPKKVEKENFIIQTAIKSDEPDTENLSIGTLFKPEKRRRKNKEKIERFNNEKIDFELPRERKGKRKRRYSSRISSRRKSDGWTFFD